MDDAVVMLWYLIQSGLLPKEHVFYQEVRAFCYRSFGSIFPVRNFHKMFPSLTAWVESNQFLHGKSASYFFCGKGGFGKGNLADTTMSPKEWIATHNFAGLSPRSITANNPTPHVFSGVNVTDLLHLYEYLNMSKPVAIDKTGVTSFLFVTSIDGMAIKPSLQVSVQDQGVIGLTDPPILSFLEAKSTWMH